MITRTDILSEAIHKCLAEMYRWSQPSIDIDKLIADGFKNDREHPLYERHYLSQGNFIYIRDRFKEAYGITDEWDDTFDTLIEYLVKGGIEDDYKPATGDRPGYRDYKEVPALETFIGKESTEQCLTLIKKCRDFYKGHCQETNQFDITMALGVGSPSSCAAVVEEYWRNNGRPLFTIKEFKVDDVLYGGVHDEYLYITEEMFIKALR